MPKVPPPNRQLHKTASKCPEPHKDDHKRRGMQYLADHMFEGENFCSDLHQPEKWVPRFRSNLPTHERVGVASEPSDLNVTTFDLAHEEVCQERPRKSSFVATLWNKLYHLVLAENIAPICPKEQMRTPCPIPLYRTDKDIGAGMLQEELRVREENAEVALKFIERGPAWEALLNPSRADVAMAKEKQEALKERKLEARLVDIVQLSLTDEEEEEKRRMFNTSR